MKEIKEYNGQLNKRKEELDKQLLERFPCSLTAELLQHYSSFPRP